MCKAEFNGTHFVSVIALSECGTTVSIQNDTVTFYNELIVRKVADDIQDVNSDSDVTYGSDYETVIPVQCIYPRHSNVSSSYIPVKQNVRFFEKHYGNLDVYMQQFDSQDFKFTIPVDGSPRKVPLNDDLYIRVGLNFDPDDVRVKADQCIATSTPNPADSHWRQLINDGCPVNNVRLLTASDSSDVKFTLKAFDFRHNASGFVYLHCQVSICGAVDDGCRMGCGARVKRSASGSDGTLLVSTGPFYVERRNQNNAVEEFAIPVSFVFDMYVLKYSHRCLSIPRTADSTNDSCSSLFSGCHSSSDHGRDWLEETT
ncbi:oncoprotein-induced transcript 3 protein-like isoform X1 [Mya arenaria]|uniref:oncoprotein-induced transcript 3 protein-like isoform X1 n=1 Tax=Mya arenaria TaxID=6604 RepID=UPI0022DEB406|nr:oncoprotein-induced transcript 3 protein-like isoform X1 [Mya arenaria]